MKKTSRTLIGLTLLSLITYGGFAFYYLKTSRLSNVVLYAVVPPSDFRNYKRLPLPFGRKIALKVLEATSQEDFKKLAEAENFSLQSVLGFNQISYDEDDASRQEAIFAIATIVLKKGLPVEEFDDFGCTPLHLAIIENDQQSIEFLRANNASFEVAGPSTARIKKCRYTAKQLLHQSRHHSRAPIKPN